MNCPYTREECMSDCVHAVKINVVNDVCTTGCQIALWYAKNLIMTEKITEFVINLSSIKFDGDIGDIIGKALKSAIGM